MDGQLNPEVLASNIMKRRLLILGLMFSGPAVLTACVIPKATQEPLHNYALSFDEGTALESRQSRALELPGLLVTVPEPAPGFESPRMVYVRIPYELNVFATSQWVDSPARMLAPLIIQRLDKSGIWSSVVHMPTPVRSDYRLDISHVALVQEFLQQPSQIRLALRAQLTTMLDPHVLGTRNFEIREDAPSEDAYGGVLAAQGAVRKLLDTLVEWLDRCLHESQTC
jgi:cholesterol transport system auxiliary component